MTKTEHSFNQNTGTSYDRFGNLALNFAPEQENNPDLDKALRLSGKLQTTLDVDKIIEIFAHEIGQLIGFEHIQYTHREQNIDLHFGEAARFSCVYRLVVSGHTLGELLFSRDKKFTKTETSQMETLLCGLVYPLRNALLYRKAIEAASKDPLTGVQNRSAMDASISREIELAKRHGNNLSLLALDIDHFKKVNDTYGHSMGDCVIKAVAEAASAAIRSSDMVFRFGGEEFVILLSSTDQAGAELLANRLRQRIEETVIICDGQHMSATVSIGVTSLHSGDDRDSMFSRADTALYQAKSAGRNRVRSYTV